MDEEVKEFLLKVNEELESIPEFQRYNIAQGVINELEFDNLQRQIRENRAQKGIKVEEQRGKGRVGRVELLGRC